MEFNYIIDGCTPPREVSDKKDRRPARKFLQSSVALLAFAAVSLTACADQESNQSFSGGNGEVQSPQNSEDLGADEVVVHSGDSLDGDEVDNSGHFSDEADSERPVYQINILSALEEVAASSSKAAPADDTEESGEIQETSELEKNIIEACSVCDSPWDYTYEHEGTSYCLETLLEGISIHESAGGNFDYIFGTVGNPERQAALDRLIVDMYPDKFAGVDEADVTKLTITEGTGIYGAGVSKRNGELPGCG
jgi:hypothetical protein